MSNPRQVTIVRPHSGPHAAVFDEFVASLFHGLQRLGCDAAIVEHPSQAVGRTILVGGFAFSEPDLRCLGADTIVYNTEHFSFISQRAAYMKLLRQYEVWDYSQDNANRLPALLGKTARYVPLGVVPELARIPTAEPEDIDILFYGSLNPRREKILDRLRHEGLNVHQAFGVYGTERDFLISRAKLIVNIHFYEPGAFEIVRIFYLLANRKAVICELNPGEFIDPDLAAAVYALPYEKLVPGCLHLLSDHVARHELEERGFRAIAARDETVILQKALTHMTPDEPTPASHAAPPRRLNLGSGKDWRPDFLNVDRNPRWNADVDIDICDRDIFEKDYSSKRFGIITIDRDFFDEIVAIDVLEHVADLVGAMTNCLDLLREGGVMRIHVPYDLSFGAWQDPTHQRAFNERSWLYFCEWFWYLDWTVARFDLINLEYGFSPLGTRMQQEGAADEEIARTPRAVDQMRVLLRKRLLTDHEREEGARWRGETR